MDVTKIIASQDPEMTETVCGDGYEVPQGLFPQMSVTLFNLFAGNMAKEANSSIHEKSKPDHAGKSATRSRNDDKRRKPSGTKNM